MKGKVGNKMQSRGQRTIKERGREKKEKGAKKTAKKIKKNWEKKKERSEGNQMKFLKFCSRPITVP